MARTAKAATEAEPNGKAEAEKPRETTWSVADEAEHTKAARSFRSALTAIVKGEVGLESGYARLAEAVMALRATYTRVVLTDGKAITCRDWKGDSRDYQNEVGKVYSDLIPKGSEHLRESITSKVRYHAQTLREAMVKDGRIPRSEADALGITKAKRTRQAEKAKEAREAAKAVREEVKAIVEAADGKAEAAMAEAERFLVRVREAIEAAPDAATLGVTPPQMQRWAVSIGRLNREAVVAYEGRGFGQVMPPAPKAAPKASTRRSA